MASLTRLVTNGLMYAGKLLPGQGGRYYHCTAAGARAVDLPVMQEPWATQPRGASDRSNYANPRICT